jgi:hypothetical protein
MRRYVVELTPAQREAVLEALASRLAGPIEGSEQRQETYEAAEAAIFRARRRTVKP